MSEIEKATMYCPQCAAPNIDGVKFCRSCGIELEAVALALSGKSTQPIEDGGNKSVSETAKEWMEKRSKGVSNITTGAILLGVSLLIGVAMGIFVPGNIPWMIVWAVFFGWMACWGGIALAFGVGGVLESKSMLRQMGLTDKESVIDSTTQQLLSPPLSVTEATTRQLNEHIQD
jgi:zinc ribbon protein